MNTKAVQFFAANAGYATPPGRMVCAKHLAEAEALADSLGLEVKWEYDTDADLSWCTKKDLEDIKRGAIEVLQAYIRDDAGNCLANLGGVSIHIDDKNYRRVVEAELKQEAIAELKRGDL